MLAPIFYSPTAVGATITVSVSPTSYTELVGTTNGTTAVPLTATPSGGTAPYTYSWDEIDYVGNGDIIAVTPSLASTYFNWDDLTAGLEGVATYQVTATDKYGNSGFFNVSIDIQRVF